MIDADRLPVRPFTQQDTIRLISTAHIDEPAMAPLADDADELAFLEEIEGLTSLRRASALPLPSGVRNDELLTERDGDGWTYVNAAFCYTRATGNRFNGPERGAWYACWGETAIETALAEVSWYLTRELEATGVYDNITRYRELVAGFTSRFHDLRSLADTDLFSGEPEDANPLGQALAQSILNNDGRGVVFNSVRRAGGQCVAAFRPHLVQNIRQGNTWVLKWTGCPDPEISAQDV